MQDNFNFKISYLQLFIVLFSLLASGFCLAQVSYEFDDLNRLAQVAYPCATTTYDYDAVGALKSVVTTGEVRATIAVRLSSLQATPSIPEVEPYTALGYTFIGEPESGSPRGNWSYVDWVVVELRDPQNPATVVASKAALLTTNGLVVDPTEGTSPMSFVSVCVGDYYVAIKHRNHLGVMTANPITFSAGSAPIVNFSDAQTATYGSNAQYVGANYSSLWPGDTNFDGKVVYVGADSDVVPISSRVLLNPGNPAGLPFIPFSGYDNSDANLNGTTVYVGNTSDVVSVSSTVLNHPSNPGGLPFIPIFAQLP